MTIMYIKKMTDSVNYLVLIKGKMPIYPAYTKTREVRQTILAETFYLFLKSLKMFL